MDRNRDPGTCYRCGKMVDVGQGFVEKVTKRQRRKWREVLKPTDWLLQHATCASRHKGTDVHYLIDPSLLNEKGRIRNEPVEVQCPYCKKVAGPTTGQQIYPHREDLWNLNFYECRPCKARVGCHKGTWAPLGAPAKGELRWARKAAHEAFDQLWRRKMAREGCNQRVAREAAYLWLGEQLGLSREACHIGMMDTAQARRVVEVCKPFLRERVA